MISPRRIVAIARKEVLHVARDPRSLYLALGMPVVLLILFGYGVSFDMDHLPVAVIDEDHSRTSRELSERMFASGEFERIESEGLTPDHASSLFDTRTAAAVLLIPHGFGDGLARGEHESVQILVDGVEANTATQIVGKTDAVLRQSAAAAVSARGAAISPPYDVRVTTWFNPGARSALFLVPGLVAYVLAIVCVLLTALTMAREYERGSMQQLFVTPVGTAEIMIGKLLPYFALGVIGALLVLAAGTWIFDVPVRGNTLALALATALFLFGMLGQGLVISIVAKSQMVATQMATMTSMLPSMLLSGFLFPIENMPLPLRVLSNVVPSRYFIHALRGILLRGNGFAEVKTDLIALAIFAAFMFLVGSRRFKRELA
jgi:ABC-2 type transport system permease protein